MHDRDLLAVTIACQDIDAYTKRDTGKARDMEVGMMPPKLCQMMINLALQGSMQSAGSSNRNSNWKNENTIHSDHWSPRTAHSIYDPFCGLGTMLIEAANMGITKIMGSDMAPRMVDSTKHSIEEFVKEEQMWQERIRAVWGTPAKDFSDFSYDIFVQDASKIASLDRDKMSNTNIVTEWYLGEIMEKHSISIDRVKQEKAKLRNMYEWFFGGLEGLDFSGNIVMTFPFWDIHGTTSYFTEIYDVIGRHGFDIVPLLPVDTMRTLMTSKGSLLYKRPGQQVGREVVKIRKR